MDKIDLSDVSEEAYKERDDKLHLANKMLMSLGTFAEEKRALKQNIKQLEKDLYRDALCCCFTRKWFLSKYLKNNIFQSNGYIVMVDLDNFKAINDTYGHDIGDDALRFISNQLMHLDTKVDEVRKVVRLGGDEFCLIVDEASNEGTILTIEEKIYALRQEILKKHFITDEGFVIRVGFSYGISSFTYSDTSAHVLKIADNNMYLNKQKNKKSFKED